MAAPHATAVATAEYDKWHGGDLPEMRAGFDEMMAAPDPDVSVTEAVVGGIPARWIVVPESADRVVLYVHGGGFMLGSSYGYRGLGSWIARAAGARVLLIDYRLAPEHAFPAAHEDVLAAYRALISDEGVAPSDIVVAGDSAGGGLALGAVIAVRDAGDALPAAVCLMSPFADLTLSSESINSLAAVDPLSSPEAAVTMSGAYLAGADPSDVRASPLVADFTGLPPLLIQVGSSEILLDDAIRIAERARAAKVPVELQIAYQMVHVFQMFPNEIPEAAAAIDDLGAFICRHCETTVSAAR